MANIQSQIKRNRQNEKRRLRNRDFRGAARTAVKDALVSMTPGQDSSASVKAAIRTLDKAAQKGAIHRRNAARRKSRLLKRLAAVGQQPATVAVASATPAPASKTKPEPKKAAGKTTAKKAAAKKTSKG